MEVDMVGLQCLYTKAHTTRGTSVEYQGGTRCSSSPAGASASAKDAGGDDVPTDDFCFCVLFFDFFFFLVLRVGAHVPSSLRSIPVLQVHLKEPCTFSQSSVSWSQGWSSDSHSFTSASIGNGNVHKTDKSHLT